MSQITSTPKALTLADKVRAKLNLPTAQSASALGGKSALLLDVSGSMNSHCGSGGRKIDALKTLAQDLNYPITFAFSTDCARVSTRADIAYLDACGCTMLGLAMGRMATLGCNSLAIVTDGLPDDAQRALQLAPQFVISIFYVGPEPRPKFLDDLARAARKGSSSQNSNLSQPLKLQSKIRGLLS